MLKMQRTTIFADKLEFHLQYHNGYLEEKEANSSLQDEFQPHNERESKNFKLHGRTMKKKNYFNRKKITSSNTVLSILPTYLKIHSTSQFLFLPTTQ